MPADARVFAQGQRADNYLVVTQGSVKVFARSEEGREVVLYRVNPGEMCTLTTACLLGRTAYPAEAVTESEVTARVLDAHLFGQMMDSSPEFRRFVFASLSGRLAEVIQRMERLVLESVDCRLTRVLLRRAGADGVVEVTHEALSNEVGTAREVVSRHLKAMERDGLIALRRGKILLLRPEALG